jgi:hypothetical protein
MTTFMGLLQDYRPHHPAAAWAPPEPAARQVMIGMMVMRMMMMRLRSKKKTTM